MAEHILLKPASLGGSQVELIVEYPRGAGLRPAVMLMHGHQMEEPRPGAAWAINAGYFRAVNAMGYVAAAVSMPGYGKSDGPPDFCGPRSQAAVRAGLEQLRRMPGVDPGRIALCGWSRGAIVSSMVAAAEPDLRALVLAAGAYDLEDERSFVLEGIRTVYLEEAGASREAALDRSALHNAHRIKVPTLILHGAEDERASVKPAIALHRRLQELDCPVKLVLFANSGHFLPRWQEGIEIVPFLKTALGDPLAPDPI